MSNDPSKSSSVLFPWPKVTLRGLLLSMLFLGCAISVWRYPWGPGIASTFWPLLISLSFLGATVGAPFGHWVRGAIIGAGAATVPFIALAFFSLGWR